MDQQSVTLRDAQGHTAAAKAAYVSRRSAVRRGIVASVWVISGFALAAPCLLVPVVHLFSTWALPLLGIVLGVRAWKHRIVVLQITGTCPACGQTIDLGGGSIDDPDWQVCPTCHAPLMVDVSES
jgi:hypothetical protein